MHVFRSALVVGVVAVIAGCTDKDVVIPHSLPPTGTTVHTVLVSPDKVSIVSGATFMLVTSVNADAGVTNRTVAWSSSDSTVARVGTDGKVTGLKAGSATIRATSNADVTVFGTSAVTVISTAPASSRY